MRKILILMAFILVMSSTLTASAHSRHHNWSHWAYHHKHWRHTGFRIHINLPFRWHEHHRHHNVVRIYDDGWSHRFPGLHAYRWHGAGFWYRDHYVTNAVLLYNHSGELVSVGFMRNGVFILVRDDDQSYENHDSFFSTWWRD
jgi:hypothetical protein